MIAELVAASALMVPPQATPGDWVTLVVQRAPQRRLVRVYLVATVNAPKIRSSRDARLHYIGSARARSGRVTLSFRVPPLNGRYRAWCAGCGAGGTLDVSTPVAMAENCPVTIAQSGPPPGLSGVWHGNDALWTSLPENGVLVAPAEDVHADGSISTKRFWYAAGIRGTFTVSGRRLDATSPALVVHTVNSGSQQGFRGSATWATFVTFPTQGCWRLTARVANLSSAVSLSFVMKVTAE